MATVILVEKKIQLSKTDIIKYQLIVHCFLHQLLLSESEINCLTLLTLYGKQNLSQFCTSAVEEGIFKTPQTVRNFLTRAESLGLIVKSTEEGSSKKLVTINDNLQIQSESPLLLRYQVIHAT